MLKLKKLVTNNFGPIIGERTIEFQSGLNLIQAENGKGKSNIIYAIEMLLIDNFDGSYEQYINNSCTDMSASLDFEVDTVNYSIVLECAKKKNMATERILYKDGAELARGNNAKEYLSMILNPDVVKYSLVAKQKNKDNIVSCSDSERRELFKKIRALDYKTKVDKKILPKMTKIKEDIIQIDKEIYSLESKIYEEEEELELPFGEAVYKSKMNQKENLLIQRNNIAERLNLLKEQKIELLRKQQSIESNTNRITSAINRREGLRSQMESKKVRLLNLDTEFNTFDNIAAIKVKFENEKTTLENNKTYLISI